eukprot:834997-Prymnesium_polylepis.1
MGHRARRGRSGRANVRAGAVVGHECAPRGAAEDAMGWIDEQRGPPRAAGGGGTGRPPRRAPAARPAAAPRCASRPNGRRGAPRPPGAPGSRTRGS